MSSHLCDRSNRRHEESKGSKYDDDKYDGDDEEDALLDEMLEKAERLRLAMLAASSAMNLGAVEPEEASPTANAAPPTTKADAGDPTTSPVVDDVHTIMIPRSRSISNNSEADADADADAVDINRKRIVTRITTTAATTNTTTQAAGSIVPAIPTTIDMADTVTECSSVGYYSIVYGSTHLANLTDPTTNTTTKITSVPQKTTSSSSRQWRRGEPLPAKATITTTTTASYHRNRHKNVEVVTEEEKTNEDGSVHYAFSDDGSSRRSRRSRTATTTWLADDDNNNNDISPKSSNSQQLSPVAVAPPDDDEVELVSVADYLKSSSKNGDPAKNGDYVTWVKVDFVDQSDDDYVPLQDYSRTVLYHRFHNDREGQLNSCTSSTCNNNNQKALFRRRRQLRKMVTFGLCCVVLAFVWSRLSNHRTSTSTSTSTNIMQPTNSNNEKKMANHPAAIGTGKTVAANYERAQARAIAGSGSAAVAKAASNSLVAGYRSSIPTATASSSNCSRPKESIVTTHHEHAMVPVSHRPNCNNHKRAYPHEVQHKRHVLGSLVQSMMHFGMGDYPYRHGSARSV